MRSSRWYFESPTDIVIAGRQFEIDPKISLSIYNNNYDLFRKK